MKPISFLFLAAAVLAAATSCKAEESPTAKLREGDRLVLLGGTFIERMQVECWFEAELATRLPKAGIVVRNLGWSGDNVWGESRALFGSREDGFKRLVSDVELTKPTVIALAYGANEAHAGEAGLEAFRAGLNRLLDSLAKTGARLVLFAPPPWENLGPPLPDPAAYNRKLEAYRGALVETAAARKLAVIDLAQLMEQPPEEPWTSNGLHLTPLGYRRLAPRLATAFGAPERRWQVALKADGTTSEAIGTELSDAIPTALGIRFTCRDALLPGTAEDSATVLRVEGLAAGKYEIRSGATVLANTTAAALGAGVKLTEFPTAAQTEKLRAAAIRKNELFFHRYRPQNETYLFLFRKHEQGNNAVEIPQFDPLVEQLDGEIHRLSIPEPYVLNLVITEATP